MVPVPDAKSKPAGPTSGTELSMPFLPSGHLRWDDVEELVHAPKVILKVTIPSKGKESELSVSIVD